MGAELPAPGAAGLIASARRILRLWRVQAMLDLMIVTRDVRTFVVWATTDVVMHVAAVTGMLLLAERFGGIGAWTKWQVVFMLGYASLVEAILSTFCNYNVDYVSRRVGRGQLDHTLIQPQPVWMSLLTEGFSPAFGVAMMAPGLALLLWAGTRLGLHPGPVWFAALAVNLAASTVVVLSFQFAWGSLAFWAPVGAEEVNSATYNFIEQLRPFPLDGLRGAAQLGLLTIVPAGLVAWLPCRWLLGVGTNTLGGLATPASAIAFTLAAVLLFNLGLRHYARVGSNRYTDFGHRR